MKTVCPLDQKPDQRIGGGEIQDVILHDPRRDDQDRLGLHRLGGRSYWINSQSWFLSTTFPGVIATVLPTTNGSLPTGFPPLATWSESSRRFSAPRIRL